MHILIALKFIDVDTKTAFKLSHTTTFLQNILWFVIGIQMPKINKNFIYPANTISEALKLRLKAVECSTIKNKKQHNNGQRYFNQT